MEATLCDVCGKIAMKRGFRVFVDLPELKWRGFQILEDRDKDGNDIKKYGEWTPQIGASIEFIGHYMQDQASYECPDLCITCIIEILQKATKKLVSEGHCKET